MWLILGGGGFVGAHLVPAFEALGVRTAVKDLADADFRETVDPEVLFLDDPTRGVDVGAKEDIYELIEDLAKAGKGVLMVSSELPELLRCCDRVLVMNQGRMAGEVDARATSQEEIMHLAAATSSQGESA